MKLYKERYLIAVYDKEDNLIDVGINVRDLATVTSEKQVRNLLAELYHKRKKQMHLYRVELIDCLEQHNDEFAEEDNEFLEFAKSLPNLKTTDRKESDKRAKELGITLRKYYTLRAEGKIV